MGKCNDYTGGQVEAVINRMGGFENWLRFAGGQGKIVFDTILTLVRTVKISAQPEVVTSPEYFEKAGVKSTGDNFKKLFLDLKLGATEAGELAVRKLEQPSLDAPILTELGDNAEISASQFLAFLDANRGSSEWFVFYLRGNDGNLWAVYAYWDGDLVGWYVSARSVESPSWWDSGSRVVSRN